MAIDRVDVRALSTPTTSDPHGTASASDDLIRQLLDKNKKKAADKREEGKVGQQRTTENKFQAAFKALKNGDAGPVGKAAAEAMDTSPMFQGASLGAKEHFAEQTAKNPQAGFDAKERFVKLTGDPKADQALNSAELKGIVVRESFDPDKKKQDTLKEFIQGFGRPEFDPKQKKGILEFGAKNPQTPGWKALCDPESGLASDKVAQLSGAAKDAMVNLAKKSDPSKPADLRSVLNLVNDQGLSKALDKSNLSRLVSIGAKDPSGVPDLEAFLKKSDKFHGMNSARRDQILDLVAKHGASQFSGITGQGARPKGAFFSVPDKVSELRRDSQQAKALRLMLSTKGELSEEEIDGAISRAKSRAANPPVLTAIEGDDPEAKKKGEMSQIAQLLAYKQRVLKFNKQIEHKIDGARSREELQALPTMLNGNALLEQVGDRDDAVAKMAKSIAADIEAGAKEPRRKYSLQRRALKKATPERQALLALKENRSAKREAKATTFTIPEGGGASSTVSFARMLGAKPTKSASDTSQQQVALSETTTTDAPKARARPSQTGGAGKAGWGNNAVVLGGIDRSERGRYKAVKPPANKGDGAAPVNVHGSTLSSGPALVKQGVEVRPLTGLLQDNVPWNKLNSSELAVLRNLGINRQVLESMRTQRPIIPNLFAEDFDTLKEHQRKSAVLVGITPQAWNDQAAQLRELRGAKTKHAGDRVGPTGGAGGA